MGGAASEQPGDRLILLGPIPAAPYPDLRQMGEAWPPFLPLLFPCWKEETAFLSSPGPEATSGEWPRSKPESSGGWGRDGEGEPGLGTIAGSPPAGRPPQSTFLWGSGGRAEEPRGTDAFAPPRHFPTLSSQLPAHTYPRSLPAPNEDNPGVHRLASVGPGPGARRVSPSLDPRLREGRVAESGPGPGPRATLAGGGAGGACKRRPSRDGSGGGGAEAGLRGQGNRVRGWEPTRAGPGPAPTRVGRLGGSGQLVSPPRET